jgi:hypothetical protein
VVRDVAEDLRRRAVLRRPARDRDRERQALQARRQMCDEAKRGEVGAVGVVDHQ